MAQIFAGLSSDDVIYVQILVLSLVAALSFKQIVNAQKRQLCATATGVFLVIFVCKWHSLYIFTLVMVNLALDQFVSPSRLPYATFAYSFSHLTFFRCAYLFGLPRPNPHTNAALLIMTLRCVGLAFELHDTREADSSLKSEREISGKRQVSEKTDTVERNINSKDMTTLKMFSYLFNFAGLFTGPYYTYRVHCDALDTPNLHSISVSHELLSRVLCIPVYAIVFLIVTFLFPLEAMRADEFYSEHGLLFRLFYMVPIFVYFRMRVYIAWMLAESTCIAYGLGAYPAHTEPKVGRGPTKLDIRTERERVKDTVYSFETVRNIDPHGCEFAPTFRESMRAWNRSVQYWLAAYIYRRAPKAYRMSLTMLVSAFWHGVHPGYYLSFLTIPLCTYAEDLAYNTWPIKNHPKTLETLWWLLRVRGIEFCATGFLLLSWSHTIRYWSSIYFCLHVCLILVILAAHVALKFKRKHSNSEDEKKKS